MNKIEKYLDTDMVNNMISVLYLRTAMLTNRIYKATKNKPPKIKNSTRTCVPFRAHSETDR